MPRATVVDPTTARATLAVPPAAEPTPAPISPPAEQVYSLVVAKHTAIILVSFTRKKQVVGTFAQCRSAYIAAQVHNVLFGFWGVLSLWLYNPINLVGNAGRYRQMRRRAMLDAAAESGASR